MTICKKLGIDHPCPHATPYKGRPGRCSCKWDKARSCPGKRTKQALKVKKIYGKEFHLIPEYQAAIYMEAP
jgi:hypothetical protein